MVLRRNDPADDDQDVGGALRPQRRDELRHQRLVAGRERGHADDVDVIFDSLARGFLRRLEQRADVDVEAEVGERGGDDLGAAVVAVLAEFHHQHPGAAPLGGRERVDLVP